MNRSRTIIILSACLACLFCGEPEPEETADAIFEAELDKRGIAFSLSDVEGLYRVQTDGGEVTVSVENVRRSFERDRDKDAVIRFVEQMLSTYEFPPWEQAKSLVYFSAEPSDYAFGNTISYKVSPGLTKALAITTPDGSKIVWLTPDALALWGVTQEEVEQAALENLSRLLEGVKLKVEEIDGMKLAMIPIDSAFKTAAIFAPNFKILATSELEWPVLAIIPHRDFLFILSEEDRALLSRMGDAVVREYQESGHPITTEILSISDEGLYAIGRFID